MADQEQSEQEAEAALAAAFRHPIGWSVLKQVRPDGKTFRIADGAVESLVGELFDMAQKGQRLGDPLNEFTRVALYFKNKKNTPVVEQLLAKVVNGLGARLGELDAARKSHQANISKFMGKPAPAPKSAAGQPPPEGSLKPWQRR